MHANSLHVYSRSSNDDVAILQVVVYTEPDALSLHVLEAEEKVCLGSSTREYTNAAKLLDAATSTGCAAIGAGSPSSIGLSWVLLGHAMRWKAQPTWACGG